MKKVKNKINVYKDIILPNIIIISLFLLIDFALGNIFPEKNTARTSHHYYHHGLRPNNKSIETWGDNVYKLYTDFMTFKSDGINEINNTNDKVKILLLGDSFTEGIGYPYEKTWAGLLRSKLDNSKYEIYNAGVASMTPRLNYLKLEYLINNKILVPDLIICLIDISDVGDEVIYQNYYPNITNTWKTLSRNIYFLIRDNFFILSKALKVLKNLNFERKEGNNNPITSEINLSQSEPKLDTMQFIQKNKDQWTSNEYAKSVYGTNGLKLLSASLKKMISLCKQNGIKIVFITYPWPKQILAEEDYDKYFLFIKDLSAKENNVFYYDLKTYFYQRDSQKVIQDLFIKGDVHWNENGNQFISEIIFNLLLNNDALNNF